MHGGGWWSYLRYDDKQDRPAISWDLIRRAASYGRPYLGGIIGMLAIIIVITLLSLIPPLLIRDLIDRTLPQRDYHRLHLLALGMIGIPLVTGLLGVAQRFLSAQVGEGVIFDLRVALFSHMQRMSLRFFTHTKTGELMSRLNNDVGGAQRAVSSTIVDLITNIITLVGTLAIMLRLEWRLTLLAVAVLPLFMIPARLLGSRLRGVVRHQMTVNAEMNAVMDETLNVSGALLVKLFGRGTSEVLRFRERAGRVAQAGIRQAFLMRWFFLTLSLVSAVGTALVFWVGGLLVLREPAFTIGTIVAFTAYLGMLYGPLASLTNARVDFATSLVSFERVFEVLDLPVEIRERPDALQLDAVVGHVRFDHVSFSYRPGEGAPGAIAVGLSEVVRFGWGGRDMWPPLSQERGSLERGARQGRSPERAALPAGWSRRGEQPDEAGREGQGDGRSATGERGDGEPRWALRDVSFEVQPGQLAALVGPSGAGKTTITYLLPRLYDPTSGTITIDGHDIRDLSLDTLAGQIGMVTQETYLFNDTIRANLLYARPTATTAEIEAACRAANIHDFIAGLPEGYETVVGNRGYRLSGGEKQRLAIARVILKDPRILVLDEATSSLDSQSEALIQEALERIMVGRTSPSPGLRTSPSPGLRTSPSPELRTSPSPGLRTSPSPGLRTSPSPGLRTSLVIAHRLSTILAADVILVLDQGRLVERGTHAGLLAQGGLYASLYETQFRDISEG